MIEISTIIIVALVLFFILLIIFCTNFFCYLQQYGLCDTIIFNKTGYKRLLHIQGLYISLDNGYFIPIAPIKCYKRNKNYLFRGYDADLEFKLTIKNKNETLTIQVENLVFPHYEAVENINQIDIRINIEGLPFDTYVVLVHKDSDGDYVYND